MKLTEILAKDNDNDNIDKQRIIINIKCEQWGIKDYTIRKDLKVDVDGNVRFHNESFFKVPINFGKVNGNFDMTFCRKLRSLEGCPEEVTGSFSCNSSVNLTSLKGGPTKVGKNFTCDNCNNITEFGYQLPDVQEFDFARCLNLTTLHGSPKRVEKKFYGYDCKALKSFESTTKYVGSHFEMNDCISIETLSGLPDEIHGNLSLSRNRAKNYLAIFTVDGIKNIEISHFAVNFENNSKIMEIINKYYHDGQNYVDCQEALLAAGFDEYAEF